MEWAKNGKGNRNPVVIVQGKKGLNAVTIKSKVEKTIKLDATGTYDPDGDLLTYKWWYMPEAGNYDGILEINDADKSIAKLTLPQEAKGKTLHIICEVTDNGKYNLKSYRRIIIHVK